MPEIMTVDLATTRMLAAIDGGLAIINGAQGAADAAHGSLRQSWSGGSSAAAAYNTGLAGWMSGLQRVENALARLNAELGDYRTIAANTESYNEERGRWSLPQV